MYVAGIGIISISPGFNLIRRGQIQQQVEQSVEVPVPMTEDWPPFLGTGVFPLEKPEFIRHL